uniref:Fibrinogen C-terminal domain-containing protein n=1 Tax=Amphimedon queenslandica TaxID=400682 RepID=A0A1X7UA35_AMPQE
MAALYDYPIIVPESGEKAEQMHKYLEIIPDLPKRNNKKRDKCSHDNANVSPKLKASDQSTKQWKPFIILIATLCLSVMLLVAILLLIATRHGINKKQDKISLNNSSDDIGTRVAQQLRAHFAQRFIHVGLIQKTRQNTKKLTKVSESLSSLNNTRISTANMMNEVLVAVKELLLIHNQSSSSGPNPISCQDIKKRQPSSPSGHYNINGKSIYCNMEELCGSGGGWTRLAYLDMADSTMKCPSGFRLYQSGGVRACGRPVSNGISCISVQFPSNGIRYSQICGRVVGYQFGTTD